MRFETVKMDESHIDDIAALEAECFSQPWSKASLREELDNGFARFFAAVVDGRAIGYIGSFNVCGEVAISNIAVSSDYRRAGVASALLEKLIDTAVNEDAEFITLEVRASNEGAISLYKKYGFTQSGLRKGFYSKPTEDAVLMKKELK